VLPKTQKINKVTASDRSEAKWGARDRGSTPWLKSYDLLSLGVSASGLVGSVGAPAAFQRASGER
jgi:hypothetical protein